MNQPAGFQDRTITCGICGQDFQWTVWEQEFFRNWGLTYEPKRCQTCREAGRRRPTFDDRQERSSER